MDIQRRNAIATAAAAAAAAGGLMLVSSEAEAGHPNIRAAINAIQAAEADMKAASHDFGGHKQAAFVACNNAVTQLRACLAYDK